MPVSLLDLFSGEVSVQILCPFFNWIICFLFIEVPELFIYFGCQPLIGYIICEYILQYYRMTFCSTDGVLCCTEAFQLNIVPPVHFCCCFPCPGRYVQEEVTHVYV